jgi:hypothetical protein
MQTTEEDISARLRADLTAFIGTENWHSHAFNKHLMLTDGVVYFAEAAGAWWFLDIIATEGMSLQAKHPFLAIMLDVREGEADIHFTDGDGLRLYRRHIHFTDAPQGMWRFYLTDNVMLLPSEY